MTGAAGSDGAPAGDRARILTLALLDARADDATICPSEVARALTTGAKDESMWRNAMPAVHAAVDALVNEGRVQLSWKGNLLAARGGPYRIGRACGTDT
ncbi:MAG: DUF3253 domain-containing protein, partial [Sphingomonas sp.]